MRSILLYSLLLVGLVACQNQEKPMNNQVTGYDHNGLPNATRDSVEFRTNPNPQQAYKVKVTVNDAPGDWGYIDFFTLYQAKNCTYTTNRYAGATGSPEHHLQVKNDGFNNNQMQGVIYLDAMLNEDYYGQGECDWKLTSITAQFKASEDPDDTLFVFSESYNTLKSNNNSLTLYYPKVNYPKTYMDNGQILEGNPDFGIKRQNENLKTKYDKDWFSINMTVEEVQ